MARLTARGRLVAWLVLGCCASAWLTGASILVAVGAVGLALLVVCWLYSAAMVSGLTGERRFISPAYQNESIRVEHTIRSTSRIAKGRLHLEDGFWTSPLAPPRPVRIGIDALRPGQSATLEHTIRCFKRGEYRIDPSSVVAEDLLGLWRSRRSVGAAGVLLVYPELLEVDQFPMMASGTNLWLGLETSRVSGDHQEFFGVREYRLGDSPRRIHWPSTVRQQRLITKEFERGVSSNVTIILDLHRDHNLGRGRHSTLEYSVVIAAALAHYLLDRGEGVQLVGYGDGPIHVPLSRGATQWYRILEQLALVRADGEAGLADLMWEYDMAIAPDSAVIAFLLDREEADAVALTTLCAKGARLFTFLFRASTFLAVEPSSQWATSFVRAQTVLEASGAEVYPVESRVLLQERLRAP